MRIQSRLLAMAVVALCLTMASESWGQLFGPRTFGRPLSRRQPPTLDQGTTQAGALQGNERFLRENRSAADFVGSSASDARAFVGALQSGQRRTVATAVEDLRERRLPASLNQPRPAVQPNQFRERLAVGFNVAPRASPTSTQDLSDRLTRCLVGIEGKRIEVSVAGRKAILRGEVLSAHDRELAKVMTLFEPGIFEVQNDLVVRPILSPPPAEDENAG